MRHMQTAKLAALAVMSSAVLLGCANSTADAGNSRVESAGTSSAAEIASESEAVPTAAAESTAESRAAAPTPKKEPKRNEAGKLVETPYFTVELPAEHAEDYAVETYSNEGDLVYTLNFYERENFETREAGFLYSISLYDRTTDFTYLPSYMELGTLMAEDGTLYNVIREYPTDVQFTQSTQQLYTTLADEEESVLASLKAKRGFTFTKGSCDHSQIDASEASDSVIPA